MKVSQLRSKMSEQLLERRKESYATNEGGLKFGSIIGAEGVSEWWCKEGEHLIDILPYIAGANNPEKKIKQGDVSDHATYYVHKNVGANDGMFVCPLANFGKPCPICEYSKELREEGAEDDVWKALKPKRMTVYNVVVYDDAKEEAKGVQIWVVAHWNMERHLNVLAQKPRGGGKVLFSHPDQGKSISFKRAGSGKDNTQYLGHNFQEREVDGVPYAIPDELLDATYCLEEIVHVADFDEISAAFFGSKGNKGVKPVEEDEEVVAEIVEIKTRGRVAKPKPEKPECFGIEIDQIDDCSNCDLYDDCMVENEKEQPAPEPEPEPEKPKTTLRGRLNRK
jgi:hypothetical protein